MNTLLAPAARLTVLVEAAERWLLAGGREVGLRPIAAADAAAEQAFFSGLSLDSRHKRFHVGLRELRSEERRVGKEC